MHKEEVAAVLDEIGTLLELQGENAFRCNAYHNAARAIEQLEADLAELVKAGKLGEIPGIGDTLRDKITTLVTTGKLPFYEDLQEDAARPAADAARAADWGRRRSRPSTTSWASTTSTSSRPPARPASVAKLKGFGAKTQQKILEGVEFLSEVGDRVRIDQADAVGPVAARRLARRARRHAHRGVRQPAARARRRSRTSTSSSAPTTPGRSWSASSVCPAWRRCSATATPNRASPSPAGRTAIGSSMNADLRVVSDEQFPFALHYFTGSKEHNIGMRRRAQARGLKLNEYELAACPHKRPISAEDEADSLTERARPGLHPAGAARRHRRDRRRREAQAARADRDGRRHGVFHCHTTDSDGAATLEEMAKAAKALGLKYLGLGRPFAIADRRQRPQPRIASAGSRKRSTRSTSTSRAFNCSRAPSATSSPTAASTTTTSCWRRSTTSWPAFTVISTKVERR